MEGKISRRTIRRWLKEWDYIVNDGPPMDYFVSDSGHKPADGITARKLNKIMLEQAYGALPPDLRRVAYYRWICPGPLSQTLKRLGYTKDQYYYRCNKVVSAMFHYLN